MDNEKRTDILTDNGYIIINKHILRELGTNAALLYGELCEEHDYWLKRNQLKDGEWFYSTIANIQNGTNLKRTAQENALKILVDNGYIETYTGGMPCKRYFKVPSLLVTNKQDCCLPTNKIVDDQQTELLVANKQVCTPPTINNNNIINNNNTNIDNTNNEIADSVASIFGEQFANRNKYNLHY